jgi:hypothetical protein
MNPSGPFARFGSVAATRAGRVVHREALAALGEDIGRRTPLTPTQLRRRPAPRKMSDRANR